MPRQNPHGHQSDQFTATADNATPYGMSKVTSASGRRKTTVLQLSRMRKEGEKIAILTAYDATFAAVADAAGVDCIMVGDSLGMVCQGRTTTVGVSLDDMCYHTRCVAQGLARCNGSALIIADLPFGSYQQSREQAISSAIRLMEQGAHMVKLEGGDWVVDVISFLTQRGIPVCGHLGLTPQTVSAMGGYRVQGKSDADARKIMEDAEAIDKAGAALMVLEMVPATLAAQITSAMADCATIGIGAGNGTAGQVLVMHDMLGANLGKAARFVRNFMTEAGDVEGAFSAYVSAVKNGAFPDNRIHAW